MPKATNDSAVQVNPIKLSDAFPQLVVWFALLSGTSDSFSIKEPRQVIHFTLSGFLFTKSAQEEYFFSLTGLPFCR